MKNILLLLVCITSMCTLKAQTDKKLVEHFIFTIRNQVLELFEYDVTKDVKQKSIVLNKFSIIVENAKKSDIDYNNLTVKDVLSFEIIGTNKKVLLAIYTINKTDWDDIILLVDKADNKIIDIGLAENCLTLNNNLRGKNYNNRDNLASLFIKNAISKKSVEIAIKNIIQFANKNKTDSLCTYLLYKGNQDTKRKKFEEACNAKNKEDVAYSNMIINKIKGYIVNENDITMQWFKVDKDGIASTSILCNTTKNLRTFYFKALHGKILLESVY